MTTLTLPCTHLHKQTSRILRIFPILIAAALFCGCSDDSGKKSDQETCTQDKCENWCGDFKTDPKHCGDCATDCTIYEGVTGTCNEGKCEFTANLCKDETDSSGKVTQHKKICIKDGNPVCASIDTDPNNCGECGHECKEEDEKVEKWMCQSGQCLSVDACGKSQIKCYCSYDEAGNILECSEEKSDNTQLLCIDRTSIDACGAQSCQNRGVICPIGKVCVNTLNDNFECQCADGFVTKEDKCLNPYDPETCGVTAESVNNDNRCKTNEICNDKRCVCAQGFEKCEGTDECVDILNNPKHCGNCDTDCGENAYCENGVCLCNKGFSRCDPLICGDNKECRESRYPHHCGAEGLANESTPNSPNFIGFTCDKTSDCIKKGNSWECACESLICDNRCIDPDHDMTYCGATNCDDGHNCYLEGRNTECNGGHCECIGNNLLFVGILETDGKRSYTTDLNDKNIIQFDCINTKTDPLCCGGKSNCLNKQCENGEVCRYGYCEESCSEEEANCNGNCLDKAEFNVEEIGDGHCRCTLSKNNKLTCPANGNADYGCLLEMGDVNNCGACGNKCEPTYSCIQGDYTCRCSSGTTECTYDAGLYDNNKSEIKRCMDFSQLHMIDCKTCLEGWGNLDKNWSNGCEANLNNNIYHCGTEDNNCSATCESGDTNCKSNLANAGGIVCQNGKCGYSTCNHEDYLDCDGDAKTGDYYFANEDKNTIPGCETNIKTSAKNCGMCGFSCESNKCEDGKCCYHNEKAIHSDLNVFKCCNNNKLYRYDHSWLKGCYDPSHYGCSETELKGDGNLGMNCHRDSERSEGVCAVCRRHRRAMRRRIGQRPIAAPPCRHVS